MATEIANKTIYSVADAADALGVTVGRVRQILTSEHNDEDTLATKLGRDWTMTKQQLSRLKAKHRELFQKKYGRLPDED